MSQKLFMLLIMLGLMGCSPAYVEVRTDVPRVKLRVVSELPGNTAFQLADVDSCIKPRPNINMLGWFHPSGDQSFQAKRRGFDRRIGMRGGEIYPSHMYAEQWVESDKPLGLYLNNISGWWLGGAVLEAALGSPELCMGFYLIELRPGRDYELVARQGEKSCEVAGFELVSASQSVTRVPIKVEKVCSGKR